MTASEATAKPVLSTSGLSVSFGGVRALVDVDIDVAAGELVGLIGPNGAGKTTFIDAITGFVGSTGTVTLDGQELGGLEPHQRARHGLARTWQSIELFDDLTVEQNLLVAARRPSFMGTVKEAFSFSGPPPVEQSIADALALLDLNKSAHRMPSELSQGQRKLVGVGRALVQSPRVLCLDEPAAGLDTQESLELGKHLRQVVDSGVPMLLIDHDMGLVLSICDRVVVLNFGQVIASGDPESVGRDPRVVEAYLGSGSAQLSAEVDAEVHKTIVSNE